MKTNTTIWNKKTVSDLFELALFELIYKAQTIHKKCFHRNSIHLSNLCNIKTGNCPENCSYCSQSKHYRTNITTSELLSSKKITEQAKHAKNIGATRFCMSASGRTPNKKDFNCFLNIVTQIKKLNIETCATLGMLTYEQALSLKEAGLDYYNHNLNTAEEYYPKIVTTHSYKDRLCTIENIRKARLKLCCGGIIGMGESREDRISFLLQLSQLTPPPESIPINFFTPIENTPLDNSIKLDNFEFVRVIAIIRIILNNAEIRIAAGRKNMTEEMQALCFISGANSIFIGEKLLTIDNSPIDRDHALLNKLSLPIFAGDDTKYGSSVC
jgi:biotin synthase